MDGDRAACPSLAFSPVFLPNRPEPYRTRCTVTVVDPLHGSDQLYCGDLADARRDGREHLPDQIRRNLWRKAVVPGGPREQIPLAKPSDRLSGQVARFRGYQVRKESHALPPLRTGSDLGLELRHRIAGLMAPHPRQSAAAASPAVEGHAPPTRPNRWCLPNHLNRRTRLDQSSTTECGPLAGARRAASPSDPLLLRSETSYEPPRTASAARFNNGCSCS